MPPRPNIREPGQSVRASVRCVRKTVPPMPELGEYALAAGRNAADLLDEAELLLRNRRWARAYPLSVLAFEEMGKAWMTIVAMMMPDDIRSEWPLTELMATHIDKLVAALFLGRFLSSAAVGEDPFGAVVAVSENVGTLAGEHNRAKQRGFYVDLAGGEVREPRTVSKAEACGVSATVRTLADYGGYLTEPGFIQWLLDGDEELQAFRAKFWDCMVAGLKDDTGETMITGVRGLMDDVGATEGIPQMLREIEQEKARERAMRNKRSQPKRPPPRGTRRRRAR